MLRYALIAVIVAQGAAAPLMSAELSSILLGTTGLWIAALVALLLSLLRPAVGRDYREGIRWLSGFTLALQLLHFGEEYLHRFHLRFPELLGLEAWPGAFFVTFNLAWLTIWGAAIAGLEKFPRAAAFPLWFLAIASAANGVAHPLLAVAAGGYFPGLWSSLPAGILGFLLLRRLAVATARRGRLPGAG